MNVPTTILIAEDDENDRFLIRRVFDKVGWHEAIDFACDGQETVDALNNNHPDSNNGTHPALLLLDIRMPRLDGFQVLEWLQEHPSLRPKTVIILSSSNEPKDMKRAFALGADDYKVKPHSTAAYVKMVEELRQQMTNSMRSP